MEVPAGEKVIVIINACLNSYTNILTAFEIMELIKCERRTADRLMSKLYDMRFELSAFDIEIIKGSHSMYGEPRKIKITIGTKI